MTRQLLEMETGVPGNWQLSGQDSNPGSSEIQLAVKGSALYLAAIRTGPNFILNDGKN